MKEAYRNPTFDAAVQMEIVAKKGCGCCVRVTELMPGVYVCNENKKWPVCKRDKKGFKYNDGGL